MPKLIDESNAQEIVEAQDELLKASASYRAARNKLWDAISKHNGRLLDGWTVHSIAEAARKVVNGSE